MEAGRARNLNKKEKYLAVYESFVIFTKNS